MTYVKYWQGYCQNAKLIAQIVFYYCVKVKVHTLDIAPLRSESPPQKRSRMARVLKGNPLRTRAIRERMTRLEVNQGHQTVAFHMLVSSCATVTLSLRESTSKNVVTLKSGLEVIQGHWKRYHSMYGFLLVFYRNFVPNMHRFWDIRLQ